MSQLIQKASFRPEDQLLLCAARVTLDDEARRAIRRLARPSLDWSRVLAQARKHEIEPLLQKHVAHLGDEYVPDEVRTELVERSRRIAFRNLRMSRELARVVETLEAEDVPVIPFKGPALGQMVYGNLSYRQFLDLDVLVPRDDFWRAKDVLQQRGYQSYREMDPAGERAFVDSQLGYEFAHPEKRVIIELHWNFFFEIYEFGLTPADVWDRHQWMSFAGSEVRRLALEDLLVYLTAHGTKHRWLKLKWLCDVAELVRGREDIDWQVAWDRASSIGGRRMLALGLHLAHELLDAPIPASILAEARSDGVMCSMARQVVNEWLFRDSDAPPEDPGTVFWFHFKERERWRDRWSHLQHHLKLALEPTDEDRAFVALPGKLSFLYYLVRPIRIARDALR